MQSGMDVVSVSVSDIVGIIQILSWIDYLVFCFDQKKKNLKISFDINLIDVDLKCHEC